MAAGAGAGTVAANVFDTLVTSWINQQARDDENKQREAKTRAVQNALAKANIDYQKAEDILNDYNKNRYNWADDSTRKEFMDLVNSYDPNSYVYNFGKFGDEYNKTVDDFIDPNAQKITEMAGLQQQADSTVAGNAGGTGALANMGYSRWNAASDLYKQAQDDLYRDRTQAYKEYSDYITNMQNKLDTLSKQQLQKIDMLGSNVEKEEKAKSDYMADLLGIIGDKTQTNINATVGAF